MITLYKDNEINFEHDGLGILNNVSSCIVNREINGEWALEMEIDLSDIKAKRIKEFDILKVPTPSGLQLFRIKEVEKNIDTISVYATHIFFDLADNYILDTNIVDKTRGQAIKQLLNNTNYQHNFKHSNEDITPINNCRVVRKNVVEAIIGTDDNSIINRYSGEIDIDNFNIYSLEHIGQKTNFYIEYSKNLTGIVESIDITNVATRIIPIGFDGIMLPEVFIDADNIKNYHAPLIKKYEFSNIKIVTAEEAETPDQIVTEAQAHEQLRASVKNLYENEKVQYPTINYTINFIDLKTTREYQQYKFLQNVNIGDIVKVTHRDLNIINLDCRLSKYSYNALTGEFESVEVGTTTKKISSDIMKFNDNLNTNKQQIMGSISGVTNGVNSLNNKVNNVTNDIGDLDNKVGILDISLNNKITNVENEVINVKTAVNNLDQKVTDINTKLDTKTNKDDVEKIIDNRTDLLRNIHIEEFTTIKDDELIIKLPAEYVGKDFQAFVSITDTLINNDNKLIGFNLKVERIDQAAGEVVIVGNKTEIDQQNIIVTGEIKGSLMVIAK